MGKIEERFDIARKELLDLSLKNPLLNYKLRATTGLEFPSINPSDVFHALVNEGKNIYFTSESSTNPTKLSVSTDEKTLRRRLIRTFRSSKMFLEEKGANILFLALGFLKWKEEATSIFYRSPLILVPVEIKRNEGQEKYYIVYSGEEIRLNVSLIAKMKADYGIDIDFDYEDEIKGIDEYMRFVNEVISTSPHNDWQIETSSGAFDFFSYAKFLMYNDLDLSVWLNEKGELDNEVLKKLFVTEFDDKLSDHIDVERELTPTGICNVVDADSSQASVIYDINQGKNMVIQGPPGTGKSQTITNIIASSIAKGKSILFVAEKKAALDVVKTRLEKVGLGDLVLELHSQKANKKDVLKSIEHTVNLGEPKINDDVALRMKYNSTKEELNNYKKVVNKHLASSQLPLVEIYGLALQTKDKLDRDNVRFPRITFENICFWSEEDFEKRHQVCKEFIELVSYVGKIEKHPLYGVSIKECLPYEQVSIKEQLSDLDDSFSSLVTCINQIGNEFGNKTINTLFESGRLINSIDLLEKYQNITAISCQDPVLIDEQTRIDELINSAKEIKKYEKENKFFGELIYSEFDEYIRLYEEYSKASFLKKKQMKEVKNKLSSFINGGYSQTKIESLYSFAKKYKNCIEHEEEFQYLFKDLYQGIISTNWEAIEDLLVPTREFLSAIKDYKVISQVRGVIGEEESLDKLCDLRATYLELKGKFEYKLKEFINFTKFDFSKKFNYSSWYEDDTFLEVKKVINNWKNNIDSIIEVVRYNSLVYQFETLKIDGLLDYYYQTGKYEHLDDILAFEYYDSLINYAYDSYPTLGSFKEFKIERVIEVFKELDNRLMLENIKHILKVHYDKMPSINDSSKEISIIRRELQKKKNQMPIRKLFAKTGATIQKIKPVFMMSPISVASFLPPKEVIFDLVVFDEASQVRPVEAFGPLLRARQIVVVGDSKQLPPTTFFDTMTSKYDDMADDDYDIANMESILSLLLAKNIPERTLSWHYRSRNQSLISVSNNEFYDRELKVFPSVYDKDPNEGLVFVYLPNAYYSRGGTRTNKLEAREVIKKAIEHAEMYPNLSLGIASFSLAQQEELYREFESQIKKVTNPKVKEFFNSTNSEPFFIKNLENVQGDERDVIFISIGYGYDEKHSISMDFGPLNKEGGERRLNVLITRAKSKCVVFSNITSHDINLSKTSAKGVIALKRFLEYAQNRIIFVSKNVETQADGFVEYIASKLQEYGYEVDTKIGVNGGVDIAIFDKELNRFTVGVECDGGSYKDLDSATDRERIRRNVLKSLGWKLYHIWSPDYYRNPKSEFDKLLSFIQEAKKEENEKGNSKNKELVIQRGHQEKIQEVKGAIPYKVYTGPKRRALVLNEYENLKPLVEKICLVESPLHVALLKKKLLALTNVVKLNEDQHNNIQKVISDSEIIELRGDFIYDVNQDKFEVRNRELLDKLFKKGEYIPDEEIVSFIMLCVESGEACDKDEIVKAIPSILGVPKGKALIERVENILNTLLAENKLYLEDGVIYIS